jgi:TetR/AcrR family transcriptional repressor of nem operon
MPKANVADKILQAGLKVFHEKGFNGCGVADITAEAGVPKGSFYNHFESKDALASAIVDVWESTAPRAMLTDLTISPLQRLRQHIDALNDMMISNDHACGCLFGNFATELSEQSLPVRDKLRASFRRWTGMLEAVIAEAQQAGEVGKDLPAADIAAFLVNAWEGAAMRAKVDKNQSSLDVFNRLVFARVLA